MVNDIPVTSSIDAGNRIVSKVLRDNGLRKEVAELLKKSKKK
ncbi:hypothetical protein [Butyricimonas sp. Marseille-P3923]|nr:hypothetical protein [Butyricimonas sp. Marseille-P3923]